MAIEARIDDLIEAGRSVLDSDFDPIAFLRWRRRAFDCLADMLGPDNVYTRHFESFVRQGRQIDRLAAVGVLSSAQQPMAEDRLDRPILMAIVRRATLKIELTPESRSI